MKPEGPLLRATPGPRIRCALRALPVLAALAVVSGARANLIIDWSNRSTSGFPTNELAVVDAAIATWENLIASQSDQANPTFVVHIGRAAEPGIGRTYNIAQNSNGIPSGAWISIDNGTYARQISQGWFVDSTPFDSSEFNSGTVAWHGPATPGGPAASRLDMFNVVLHELGHALGFSGYGGNPFTRWVNGHHGTVNLNYGGQTTARLYSTSPNGLAHLKHNTQQPYDLMATANDLPTGGIGDRRIVSPLDLTILTGVYGYETNADALGFVPEPSSALMVVVLMAAGLRRR